MPSRPPSRIPPVANPSPSLPWSNVQGFTRLLLHGSPDSRRAAAQQLLAADDHTWWNLLTETVRSGEHWLLRARCLEILGLAAGSANQQTAESILIALLERRDADG